MENSRFDGLAKVFATRRPRRAAFPLLAALGLGLAPTGETGAKKNTNAKKIRVCSCASADAATCQTQK